MRIRLAVSCLLVTITVLPLVQCSSESVPYPGSELPGLEPHVFAAGIVSTDRVDFTPAFSPDGRELYFTSVDPPAPTGIWFTAFENDQWSAPALAPFCGNFSDGTAAFSPDGKTLYFSSNRPIDEYMGVLEASNIWKVTKIETGWSEPQEVGPPINSTSYERSPSLARDGTMYFQSNVPGGKGEYDIYMSTFQNGNFAMPENLGDAINTDLVEADPCIAPDQSFLVFYSYQREDGFGDGDLYVSFKDGNGNWTRAVNLGKAVNTEAEESFPTLSPDGKYLFFSSTRGPGRKYPDIFWVDAEVIEAARP
jgi:Tol biopolymer transport system component